MITKPVAAAVLSLSVFTLVGHTTQQVDDCPGPNTRMHKAKPYYFTYESWVKKDPTGSGFIFGRCVQTKNQEDLFVDWKKTFVKGFATPGWPCHHELPAPKPDSVQVKSDLWYGAAPDKIEVPYEEVKQIVAKGPVPVSGDKLTSRVKMSIPRVAGKTPREARQLVRIDVVFVSEAHKKEGKYEYTYTWGPVRGKVEPQPVQFRWRSPSVMKAAQGKAGKEGFALLQFGDGPRTARLLAEAAPAYRVSVVEFLDAEGRQVVGTAPVAIYYPQSGKR